MGKCLFMRKGETHTAPVARLPKGYTSLVYIQGDGSAYINTGVIPSTNDFLIEADMESTLPINYENWFVEVNMGGSSSPGARLQMGIWSSKWGFHMPNVTVEGGGTATSARATISFGVRGTALTISGYGEPYTAANGYLGGSYRNGTICVSYRYFRTYGCKVYLAGELVRDYLPCVDPNGNIGMYDCVGQQFYGNAGSGTFIGSEVA